MHLVRDYVALYTENVLSIIPHSVPYKIVGDLPITKHVVEGLINTHRSGPKLSSNVLLSVYKDSIAFHEITPYAPSITCKPKETLESGNYMVDISVYSKTCI